MSLQWWCFLPKNKGLTGTRTHARKRNNTMRRFAMAPWRRHPYQIGRRSKSKRPSPPTPFDESVTKEGDDRVVSAIRLMYIPLVIMLLGPFAFMAHHAAATSGQKQMWMCGGGGRKASGGD